MKMALSFSREIRALIGQSSEVSNGQTVLSSGQSTANSNSIFEYFSWGGKIARMLPENFEFPAVDVKTMWNLWYFGNSGLRIRPYKNLTKFHDDLRTARDKTRFSRAKRVITNMESIYMAAESGDLRVSDMTLQASDALFERTFAVFIGQLYPEHRRTMHKAHEIMVDTLANRIYAKSSAASTSGAPAVTTSS